jgi:amidase
MIKDGDFRSLTSRITDMVANWEEIAKEKRAALLYTIPNEWIIPDSIKPPESQLDVTGFPQESGWFTPKELEITATSATDLLTKTTTGQWSVEEVTMAFCKRASAAQQLVYLLGRSYIATRLTL